MEMLEISIEVKDIIQAVLKAKKTVRMYPENNPVYTKILDETFAKFDDFFNQRDELTLKIRQNEIFFDAEQVYYNPEKEDNFALFFFKDGLRELSFKKGLSALELEEFLKIISLDFEKDALDDDIVTLLWEKNYQNIKYIADESFLIEDEGYESKAAKEIKEKSAGVDELQKAYDYSFGAEDLKNISIVNLSDKDLQLLVKEIDSDIEDKTEKIANIVFEMLIQAENTTEYRDVYQFLKEIILYSLKQGNLNIFIAILRRASGLAEGAIISNNNKPHMEDLLAFVNSNESIKYVGEILDSDIEIDETILSEYIEFLDKNSLASYILLLGELKTIRGRGKVINILVRLGKKDIQPLLKSLQDHRWYVVRNIIYILRQIGDKKGVEHLINTAKHNDVRVRKESIKALGELKSPMALPVLKESLDDADLSVKKAAVKALGNIGNETVKRMILSKVSEKDFKKRDFNEKKIFYETLAKWNDDDVVNFMIRILKRWSFFKMATRDEDRACAAHCLGLMGNKDVLPVLEKLRNSRNKLLNEHVNEAINKIEHGK